MTRLHSSAAVLPTHGSDRSSRGGLTAKAMIPNEGEFLDALRKVTSVFASLGIDYAVGGSFASSVYGEARATRDVDLIAAVAGRHAQALVSALGSEFYADLDQISAAIRTQGSFNLVHLDSMSKIDVYVVWRTEFGQAQLTRRRQTHVGTAAPLGLYITSPEDTVLAKLDWYRQGGAVSDRQWRDVLGVLRVQGSSLDWGYLRDWAGRLELTNLLQHARAEAGLPCDE